MFNKKYVKEMIALTEELQEARNAKPYDVLRYERVIEKINIARRCLYTRGRYYRFLFWWFCVCLLLVLCYIVYLIIR